MRNSLSSFWARSLSEKVKNHFWLTKRHSVGKSRKVKFNDTIVVALYPVQEGNVQGMKEISVSSSKLSDITIIILMQIYLKRMNEHNNTRIRAGLWKKRS